MEILSSFRAKSSAKQLLKNGFVLTLSILLSSLGLVLLHEIVHGNEGRSFAFAVLSDARGAYRRLVKGSNLELHQSNASYDIDHQQPEMGTQRLSANFTAGEAADPWVQAHNSSQGLRNTSVFEEQIGAESKASDLGQQGTNATETAQTAPLLEDAIPSIASNASASEEAVPPIASDGLVFEDPISAEPSNVSAFEDATPSVASDDSAISAVSGDIPVPEEATPSVAGDLSAQRTLFIVSTHHLDSNIEAEFEHMMADVGEENAVLLFDETHEPYSGRWQRTFHLREGPFAYRTADLSGPGPLVLLTNSEELRQGSNLFWDGWNSAHGKLAVLYRSFLVATRFKHVWIFESDVRCGGSYKRCVAKADHMGHDLLGQELMVGGEETRFWPHWDEFDGPIELEKRVKAFLPAMRLSRFAFEILSTADYDGTIRGYQEVYIPTILSAYGATCGELPVEMLGVYQFRPRISNAEFTALTQSERADPDMLYHPVMDG